VKLPPEKHRSSQTAFPAIVAPAASRRVTTVASRDGTKPSDHDRSGAFGAPAAYSCSTRSEAAKVDATAGAKALSSASVRPNA
jgi:hypothetical protein